MTSANRLHAENDYKSLPRLSQDSCFEDWWQVPLRTVGEPNIGRGGISRVGYATIEFREGKTIGVYAKKQENYLFHSFRHPYRGQLLLKRERSNFQRLQNIGIPVPEIVYFGESTRGAIQRGILVTKALDHYISLEQWLRDHEKDPCFEVKHRLISKGLASLTKSLHDHCLQFNCFYPKHIWVRELDKEFQFVFIDLEKIRRVYTGVSAMMRDLDTLNRHTDNLSYRFRLRFLLDYLGQDKVDRRVVRISNKLQLRYSRNHHKRG